MLFFLTRYSPLFCLRTGEVVVLVSLKKPLLLLLWHRCRWPMKHSSELRKVIIPKKCFAAAVGDVTKCTDTQWFFTDGDVLMCKWLSQPGDADWGTVFQIIMSIGWCCEKTKSGRALAPLCPIPAVGSHLNCLLCLFTISNVCFHSFLWGHTSV